MVNGVWALLNLRVDGSGRAATGDRSRFTIHHSRPRPSTLRALHGGVEKPGRVEDEEACAFVFERGAQEVWRGRLQRRERRGVDSDGSLYALDGERELLVAAQGDDE